MEKLTISIESLIIQIYRQLAQMMRYLNKTTGKLV